MVGKELTPRSSSKASWQHSQYPFFLLGTVQAADRRLGSWSLASLARGQGGGKQSLLGPSEQELLLRGLEPRPGQGWTKMARAGQAQAGLPTLGLRRGSKEGEASL